mgnify:CR=1 FL=1
MPLHFGLALEPGPRQDQPVTAWLDGLDAVIPRLAGRFTSLWLTDHFMWEDAPTFEAWTAMAFLAARYPAFQIGSAVLSQSYRNPALLAKMAATLHGLSGGRLILGLGAGWKEDEYRAYGYEFPDPKTRVDQLAETLEIVTRLWSNPGPVTYEGRHYRVVGAWCEPRPDPRPTLLVGGRGRRTGLLAVRYADWWNIPDAGFDEYRERAAVVRGHCERTGRDPASLRLTWFGRIALGRSEAQATARASPRWTRANAFVGTPAAVVEQIAPFIELGVTCFMFEVQALSDPEVIPMLVEEVLPALSGLAADR